MRISQNIYRLAVGLACLAVVGCDEPSEVAEYEQKAREVKAEVDAFRPKYQAALEELRLLEREKRDWDDSTDLPELREKVASKKSELEAARLELERVEKELETMKATSLP